MAADYTDGYIVKMISGKSRYVQSEHPLNVADIGSLPVGDDLNFNYYSYSDSDTEIPQNEFERNHMTDEKGISKNQSHVRSDSDSTNTSFFPASSSTQSIDSDGSSTVSTNSINRNKYLYPDTDSVEELRPEEVRWMYKDFGDKKWKPFIGYDSLRIECKYRETLHRLQLLNTTEDVEDSERVIVRGGLYEVDVTNRKCYPIYWMQKAEELTSIMRGTWFFENTWQPIEESYAVQIEAEHLAKFQKQKLSEDETDSTKGPPSVLHNIKFKEFHVDWNSISRVYLHSDAASSKFYRAVGTKLGLNKSGSRLHRSYPAEAKMDDKPPDITHLIFVIHGIGQKMETGSIIKSCKDLRANCRKLKEKFFPDLDKDNKRVEFLPVEWRSSLKLDGDTVESITPNKIKGLRMVLNSSAMDVLYYTSPLYRSEITQGLQTELNKLYTMFCARHPYFEASGGKVSIVAHSLGCVITYDIITGWNPIQLYDQYVCNFIRTSAVVKNKMYFSLENVQPTKLLEKKCEEVDNCSHLISELEKSRQRVNQIEQEILKLAEEQHLKTPTLQFKLENFFCLGSPLAVFLALRGIRPHCGTDQNHILPTSLCKRLYNIYHPSDPVAYRLEPLLLKHYANYKPVKIHRHDASKREDYESLPLTPINNDAVTVVDTNHVPEEAELQAKEEDNGDVTINAENEKADVKMKTSPTTKGSGGWNFIFSRNKRNKHMEDTSKPSETELKDLFSSGNKPEDNQTSYSCDNMENQSETSEDNLKLDHRIDFQLREGKMENAYIAALTSHTSYWNRFDIALFIMTQIFPDYGPR